SYERFPFRDWRRECNRDNYSIPLAEIQKELYQRIGIKFSDNNDHQFSPGYSWQWQSSNYAISAKDFNSTLEDYTNNLEAVLQESNYDKIKEKSELRRRLLDFAVFQNDAKLFSSIVLQDVDCLLMAWQFGKQAEVAGLMFLGAEDLHAIDQLFAAKVSLGELRFAVLNMI